MLLAEVQETSQVADANVAIGTRVVHTEFDCGVRSGLGVEYRTRDRDTIDAMQFDVMILDFVNSFMFGSRDIRCYTDTGA